MHGLEFSGIWRHKIFIISMAHIQASLNTIPWKFNTKRKLPSNYVGVGSIGEYWQYR